MKLVSSVIAFCLVPAAVSAATLRAPSEHAAVTAAVAAANAGDTIVLADGIYTAEADVDVAFDKALTVTSRRFPSPT